MQWPTAVGLEQIWQTEIREQKTENGEQTTEKPITESPLMAS